MSHDIFVSYSRRDTDRMIQVRLALRAANLGVWTDEGIEPGTESWKQALSRAIKECKWVVVLFSPDSANSTWVSRELDFAELHGKKIYPLLVRGEVAEAIPFGFTMYQFIDIRQDQQVAGGLQKLIDTLRGNFDGTQHTPSTHPPLVETEAPAPPAPAKPAPAPEPAAPQQEAVLWKWVETQELRLTLPSTAKTSKPDEANLQRVIRLIVGEDDSLLVRVFRNWDKLGYLYTGMKGIRMEPLLLFSDIAELSPVIGVIGELNAWFFNPFNHLVAPFMIRHETVRESMRREFGIEVQDMVWTDLSTARVVSGVAYGKEPKEDARPVAYKVYGIFFYGNAKPLIAVTSCEEARFASAEAILDQIVKSLVHA